MYERVTHHTCHHPCPPAGFRYIREDVRIPGLYDLYDLHNLYDLAHVAGWKQRNLHDLAHVSWVGYVLYRSCTTPHGGRSGSTIDGLQVGGLNDLSVNHDLSVCCVYD